MSGVTEVRHPVFARLWSVMSRHEPEEIGRHREEVLAGLAGRVLELGAGAGSNFAHYPNTVAEVVAVEPEPYLRRRAEQAAARARVRVQDALDRLVWPRAFGGCHIGRDTPAAIAAAGFVVEERRDLWVGPRTVPTPIGPHVIGRARRG
jgi:SAM-dependent methyltransferase